MSSESQMRIDRIIQRLREAGHTETELYYQRKALESIEAAYRERLVRQRMHLDRPQPVRSPSTPSSPSPFATDPESSVRSRMGLPRRRRR